MKLDAAYWNQRYLDHNTPWDVGKITPPLQAFLDQIEDREARILIPGAGLAHEAIYLHQQGFQEVYVCDWAESALRSFQDQVPDFPSQHLVQGDFFEINDSFDYLIEQTFFCALAPELRPAYAKKTANLLQNEGVLAGLLFATPFPFDGPPFGGTPEEYRQLFLPYYHIRQFAIASNSITPRAGRELFIELEKKPPA